MKLVSLLYSSMNYCLLSHLELPRKTSSYAFGASVVCPQTCVMMRLEMEVEAIETFELFLSTPDSR